MQRTPSMLNQNQDETSIKRQYEGTPSSMEYCLKKPCGKLTPLLSKSNDRAVADWNDTGMVSPRWSTTSDKYSL